MECCRGFQQQSSVLDPDAARSLGDDLSGDCRGSGICSKYQQSPHQKFRLKGLWLVVGDWRSRDERQVADNDC